MAVQKEVVELVGTIVDQITARKYLVRINSHEFKGELMEIDQSGASYYDGIMLYKDQKVAIDYRRSRPEKSQITYRL